MNVTPTSTSQPITSSQYDRSVLGKDDFLKLFIEQLKNQDPTQPMDNSQLTTQMAQFSLVEQMTNLSDTADKSIELQYSMANSLQGLSGAFAGNSLANYSSLIGKNGHWLNEQGTEMSGQITSVILKNSQVYAVVDGTEVSISDLNKIEMGI